MTCRADNNIGYSDELPEDDAYLRRKKNRTKETFICEDCDIDQESEDRLIKLHNRNLCPDCFRESLNQE